LCEFLVSEIRPKRHRFELSSQNCQKRLLVLSFCPSIRPSVCLHATFRHPLEDFREIWYWSIFQKSVENFQVLFEIGQE